MAKTGTIVDIGGSSSLPDDYNRYATDDPYLSALNRPVVPPDDIEVVQATPTPGIDINKEIVKANHRAALEATQYHVVRTIHRLPDPVARQVAENIADSVIGPASESESRIRSALDLHTRPYDPKLDGFLVIPGTDITVSGRRTSGVVLSLYRNTLGNLFGVVGQGVSKSAIAFANAINDTPPFVGYNPTLGAKAFEQYRELQNSGQRYRGIRDLIRDISTALGDSDASVGFKLLDLGNAVVGEFPIGLHLEAAKIEAGVGQQVSVPLLSLENLAAVGGSVLQAYALGGFTKMLGVASKGVFDPKTHSFVLNNIDQAKRANAIGKTLFASTYAAMAGQQAYNEAMASALDAGIPEATANNRAMLAALLTAASSYVLVRKFDWFAKRIFSTQSSLANVARQRLATGADDASTIAKRALSEPPVGVLQRMFGGAATEVPQESLEQLTAETSQYIAGVRELTQNNITTSLRNVLDAGILGGIGGAFGGGIESLQHWKLDRDLYDIIKYNDVVSADTLATSTFGMVLNDITENFGLSTSESVPLVNMLLNMSILNADRTSRSPRDVLNTVYASLAERTNTANAQNITVMYSPVFGPNTSWSMPVHPVNRFVRIITSIPDRQRFPDSRITPYQPDVSYPVNKYLVDMNRFGMSNDYLTFAVRDALNMYQDNNISGMTTQEFSDFISPYIKTYSPTFKDIKQLDRSSIDFLREATEALKLVSERVAEMANRDRQSRQRFGDLAFNLAQLVKAVDLDLHPDLKLNMDFLENTSRIILDITAEVEAADPSDMLLPIIDNVKTVFDALTDTVNDTNITIINAGGNARSVDRTTFVLRSNDSSTLPEDIVASVTFDDYSPSENSLNVTDIRAFPNLTNVVDKKFFDELPDATNTDLYKILNRDPTIETQGNRLVMYGNNVKLWTTTSDFSHFSIIDEPYIIVNALPAKDQTTAILAVMSTPSALVIGKLKKQIDELHETDMRLLTVESKPLIFITNLQHDNDLVIPKEILPALQNNALDGYDPVPEFNTFVSTGKVKDLDILMSALMRYQTSTTMDTVHLTDNLLDLINPLAPVFNYLKYHDVYVYTIIGHHSNVVVPDSVSGSAIANRLVDLMVLNRKSSIIVPMNTRADINRNRSKSLLDNIHLHLEKLTADGGSINILELASGPSVKYVVPKDITSGIPLTLFSPTHEAAWLQFVNGSGFVQALIGANHQQHPRFNAVHETLHAVFGLVDPKIKDLMYERLFRLPAPVGRAWTTNEVEHWISNVMLSLYKGVKHPLPEVRRAINDVRRVLKLSYSTVASLPDRTISKLYDRKRDVTWNVLIQAMFMEDAQPYLAKAITAFEHERLYRSASTKARSELKWLEKTRDILARRVRPLNRYEQLRMAAAITLESQLKSQQIAVAAEKLEANRAFESTYKAHSMDRIDARYNEWTQWSATWRQGNKYNRISLLDRARRFAMVRQTINMFWMLEKLPNDGPAGQVKELFRKAQAAARTIIGKHHEELSFVTANMSAELREWLYNVHDGVTNWRRFISARVKNPIPLTSVPEELQNEADRYKRVVNRVHEDLLYASWELNLHRELTTGGEAPARIEYVPDMPFKPTSEFVYAVERGDAEWLEPWIDYVATHNNVDPDIVRKKLAENGKLLRTQETRTLAFFEFQRSFKYVPEYLNDRFYYHVDPADAPHQMLFSAATRIASVRWLGAGKMTNVNNNVQVMNQLFKVFGKSVYRDDADIRNDIIAIVGQSLARSISKLNKSALFQLAKSTGVDVMRSQNNIDTDFASFRATDLTKDGKISLQRLAKRLKISTQKHSPIYVLSLVKERLTHNVGDFMYNDLINDVLKQVPGITRSEMLLFRQDFEGLPRLNVELNPVFKAISFIGTLASLNHTSEAAFKNVFQVQINSPAVFGFWETFKQMFKLAKDMSEYETIGIKSGSLLRPAWTYGSDNTSTIIRSRELLRDFGGRVLQHDLQSHSNNVFTAQIAWDYIQSYIKRRSLGQSATPEDRYTFRFLDLTAETHEAMLSGKPNDDHVNEVVQRAIDKTQHITSGPLERGWLEVHPMMRMGVTYLSFAYGQVRRVAKQLTIVGEDMKRIIGGDRSYDSYKQLAVGISRLLQSAVATTGWNMFMLALLDKFKNRDRQLHSIDDWLEFARAALLEGAFLGPLNVADLSEEHVVFKALRMSGTLSLFSDLTMLLLTTTGINVSDRWAKFSPSEQIAAKIRTNNPLINDLVRKIEDQYLYPRMRDYRNIRNLYNDWDVKQEDYTAKKETRLDPMRPEYYKIFMSIMTDDATDYQESVGEFITQAADSGKNPMNELRSLHASLIQRAPLPGGAFDENNERALRFVSTLKPTDQERVIEFHAWYMSMVNALTQR